MNETWLNSYMRQILNSDMIWAHDKKDEIHRWFTYTFIHSSTSHITTNVILQVRPHSLSTDLSPCLGNPGFRHGPENSKYFSKTLVSTLILDFTLFSV